MLEHVGYRNDSCFKVQQFIDPIWTRVFGGCHITRRIAEQTLNNIGFSSIDLKYSVVEMRHRYLFWMFWAIQPHIVGKAIK